METLPENPSAQKALIEERLRMGTQRMNNIETQISGIREELDQVKEKNRKQDELLENIKKDTADLIMMWQTGNGTVKFFKALGKVAIFFGSIAGAIYSLYIALTTWRGGGL